MEFVIVTGLSGAGKTSAMKALEDIGYFCIDNMPPQMIPKFVEICKADNIIKKVAIATDIRGGNMLFKLDENISQLVLMNVNVKVLFITANIDILLKRFKETRRRHPLDEQTGGDIRQAIHDEIEVIRPIMDASDYIIDTSEMRAGELKQAVVELFLEDVSDSMIVNISSFGFKYSSAGEADLVFDVRCLPNPFYVPSLRDKTGLDQEVRDYVMSFAQAKTLEEKLFDLVDFLIPHYRMEGKSQLVIAFGCTGGKHRSVTFAENMQKHLNNKGIRTRLIHRNINKK